jgi:hypothetical protein
LILNFYSLLKFSISQYVFIYYLLFSFRAWPALLQSLSSFPWILPMHFWSGCSWQLTMWFALKFLFTFERFLSRFRLFFYLFTLSILFSISHHDWPFSFYVTILGATYHGNFSTCTRFSVSYDTESLLPWYSHG